MKGLHRLVATGLGVVEILAPRRRGLAARRGRALVDGDDVERALLYLHRHLALHPDEPWLHYHAGRAAQAKGLTRQARVRFAHAAALAADEPTFRFALGCGLRLEGHLAAAAREYRAALRKVPDDPRVLFNLGVVERERGRLGRAQVCFEAVKEIWPKDTRVIYTLGVCAFERKDFDGSSAALYRVLELDRRHHKARYQLALIHLENEDHARAQVELKRVLKLQPSYGPAHYTLGRSITLTDPKKAARHFHEAVLGHPSMTRAHLDLGRLHEQAGRVEAARSEYILFARHHPDRRKDWVRARIKALNGQLRPGHGR